MRHVTLPTALRYFHVYSSKDIDGVTYTMYGAEDVVGETVELPSSLYDPRGHNTQVNHSEVVSVQPAQASETSALYVNSSTPVFIMQRAKLKNGISYCTAGILFVKVDEDGKHVLHMATGKITHGIGSNFTTYTCELWSSKLDYFSQDNYFVGYRWDAKSFEEGRYTDYGADVQDWDPTPVARQAMGLVVTQWNHTFFRDWKKSGWIYWSYPKIPKSIYPWSFYEPSWLITHQGIRPEAITKAMSAAFKSAYDQFPKAADNNVANGIELAKMTLDLFRGNGLDLLDSLRKLKKKKTFWKGVSECWLWYRYAYSTTKSDTRQAIEARARKQILYMKPLHFNGQAPVQYDAYPERVMHDCLVRVGFDVRQQTSDMIRAIKHGLHYAGLDVTLYTAWDLVPFSFVLDWAFDIGGMLETQVAGDHYSDYLFTNVCWSLKYNYDRYFESSKANIKCYSRWYDNAIPGPCYTYEQVSDRTWIKRAGDTVALVVH